MNRKNLPWLPIAALLALAACAQATTVAKTLDRKPTGDFDNILVVGVAADYHGRGMFERAIVSHIREARSSADAIVGRLRRNRLIGR